MDTWRDHVDKSCWVNASVDFEPNKTRAGLVHSANLLSPKENESLIWNRFAMHSVSYQKINKKMLNCQHEKNHFRTIFIDFDDSPRRKSRAVITKGSSPRCFGKYLKQAISLSQKEGNEYLFINAWNEWGEGNYLEPDARYGYAYLNQIRRVVKGIEKHGRN